MKITELSIPKWYSFENNYVVNRNNKAILIVCINHKTIIIVFNILKINMIDNESVRFGHKLLYNFCIPNQTFYQIYNCIFILYILINFLIKLYIK